MSDVPMQPFFSHMRSFRKSTNVEFEHVLNCALGNYTQNFYIHPSPKLSGDIPLW